MKKTDTNTALVSNRRSSGLLGDIRGASEMVQALILVALVALAGLVAFRELGTSVSDKAKAQKEMIDRDIPGAANGG